MSKNIWLHPNGTVQGIGGGNSYRAALAIFEGDYHLYEAKAKASVDIGKVVELEKFLLDSGFALFTNKEATLPINGLSTYQILYIKVNIHDFNELQQKALIEGGYITPEQVANNTLEYYKDILAEVAAKYEQPILDTYGNTHDFNRDRYTIEHSINQYSKTNKEDESEERERALTTHLFRIRLFLFKFGRFAEGEMKEIRIRERLVKMDNWEAEGKLYSYLREKRDNIKRMLGMEVTV
jgi:hypothetical protein